MFKIISKKKKKSILKPKINSLTCVFGCSYGGTNLTWNIIQSHPSIISNKFEYNEIFRKKDTPFYLRFILMINYFTGISLPIVDRYIINFLIDSSISYTLDDKFNKYKLPKVKYKESDFKNNINIVIKIIYHPSNKILWKYLKRRGTFNYLNQLKNFNNFKVVFITKKKALQIDSWHRRGFSKLISNRYLNFYYRYKKIITNKYQSIEINFNELTDNPFKLSRKIFSFIGVDSIKIKNLRIKVKNHKKSKILTNEKKKVWINNKNFSQHIIK